MVVSLWNRATHSNDPDDGGAADTTHSKLMGQAVLKAPHITLWGQLPFSPLLLVCLTAQLPSS